MFKPFLTTGVLIALCAVPTLEAQRKVILPKGAEPNAGWSYGILVDGALYISGMGGEDKAGKIAVVVSKLVGTGHVEITATARK